MCGVSATGTDKTQRFYIVCFCHGWVLIGGTNNYSLLSTHGGTDLYSPVVLIKVGSRDGGPPVVLGGFQGPSGK